MSLIRPDAADGLKRWAEPLLAAALIGWGLWWGLTSLGVIKWLGFGLILLGGVLLILGIRRARFWKGADGVGHVEVDEGVISYFSPAGGGSLEVRDLQVIQLIQVGETSRMWQLKALMTPPLYVPVNASGAEALFDVFANLPGLDMQGLLARLNGPATNDVVIWRRNHTSLH